MKSTAGRLRGLRRLAAAAFAFTALAGTVCFAASLPGDDALGAWVAKADGDPISIELFERRLAANRSFAYAYFAERHGAVPDADFWITSYDGEIPAEWLKRRALEECVRIQVEFRLTKERGLITDTSYKAFLKTLDDENRRRKEALAMGRPIYGPRQYKEDEFLLYFMNNLRLAVQKDSWKDNEASEEALRVYYEKVKQDQYQRGDRVTVWAIAIQYGRRDGTDKALTREEALAKIMEAKRLLEEGERFEDLAARYNEDSSLNEETFDYESRPSDKTHRAVKRAEAMALPEGATSDVFEDMSVFYLLKCVAREPQGFVPYEVARDSVKRNLMEERYQTLVAARVQSAEVQINQPALDLVEVR